VVVGIGEGGRCAGRLAGSGEEEKETGRRDRERERSTERHAHLHARRNATHARTHARTPAESADGAGQDWLARPVIITAFALVCSSRHLRLLLECLEVGAPANTTKIAHYITYNNLLPLPTQHPPYI
jgi:ABC-type nickel/cobalt efflux system permease component RcnA